VTRNAVSAATQWHALKQEPLADQRLDVTFALRHDRAAPLYRTPAASVSADEATTRLSAQAALAGATAQWQSSVRLDNLARIATLLRTRTDSDTLAVNLPLPAWVGATDKPATRWPSLAWTVQRTHQRAVNAPSPLDSGIAPTHRPDQVNTSRQVNLAWSLGPGSVTYGVNQSTVDNRQPGRERADFRRLAHQASVNWSFGEALRLGTNVSRTRQLAEETGLVSRTLGGGVQIEWQPSERWAIAGSATHDGADDSRDQARNTSRGAQFQLTRRFDVAGIDKPLPGQFFLRLGYQSLLERTTPFGLATQWNGRWIDAGLSVNFY
jgi:hypothetical protein